MNWIKQPGSAVITTVFVLVVVTPIIFFALFGLSFLLIKPHNYYSSNKEVDTKADDNDQTDKERVVYIYY